MYNTILNELNVAYNVFHMDLSTQAQKCLDITPAVEGQCFTYYGTESPLDQFDLRNLLSIDAPILGNINISLSNIGLYLSLSIFIIVCINVLATKHNKVIAHGWSVSIESLYATVHSIVINQINDNKGQSYFFFIFSLFILILVSNLIGMVPYSFVSTSLFILTFYISFITFISFIL